MKALTCHKLAQTAPRFLIGLLLFEKLYFNLIISN
mgnify:CR=1 FL=1